MKKTGFTLIELLIVITIIGILAVALLPSVLGTPARARDAQRKADLNKYITAIESYFSDNGKYPVDDPPTDGGICFGDVLSVYKTAGSDLLNKYFAGATPPANPQGKGFGFCNVGQYLYCKGQASDKYNFYIAAYVETAGNANYTSGDFSIPSESCNKAPMSPKTPPDISGVPGTPIYVYAISR